MATFVLVSGAWHAAWCWERVTPLLEAAGHTVVAPNLIGMTDDGTALTGVTLATWADQVADMAAAQSEPVFLVGHSRGGVVISEAAERVPARIRSLVYLAAFLLETGQSLWEVSSSVERDYAEDILVMAEDMRTSSIRSDSVGPIFYNTTDPHWTARAVAQVRPEPMVSLTTPVTLTPARFGSVRRAYIECQRDRAVPIALQRQMQAALPCDPVFTLDTDHSPFFSDPEALAHCLFELTGVY